MDRSKSLEGGALHESIAPCAKRRAMGEALRLVMMVSTIPSLILCPHFVLLLINLT